jgi:SAM-dependent methyltransferase
VLWNLYSACYDLIAGLAPYGDMLDEVVAALDLRPGMRVLDAGCGTGALEARLAVVAVDASSAMVARARRRQAWPAGTRFVVADINDFLANQNERFDRVVSVNLLWALADPAATIKALAAYVCEGGRMVHTTPRWRFRFDVIMAQHLRRTRGVRGFVRALGVLPLLAVAGLLNLVLVLRVLAHTWRDRSRWQADGLARLFAQPGFGPAAIRPTYAGQGFLVACDNLTPGIKEKWTSKN